MTKKLFCIALLFFIFSCSKDRSSGQERTRSADSANPASTSQTSSSSADSSFSLTITPEDAARGSLISAASSGFSLSNAKLEWLVNGEKADNETSFTFDAGNSRKGDTVQARAIVNDTEVLSNIITIKNSRPEFAYIKIMPEVFRPGDTLYADVQGKDLDDDEVTTEYEWNINGQFAGSDKAIKAPVKRGDNISVKLTLYDGDEYSRPVTFNKEIKNMPPTISDDRSFTFDGKQYSHQVRATDPDGDTLTFSLKSAPEGMSIDQTTGLIQWSVPAAFTGRVTVTVTVTDGNGGESTRQLTFIINPAK
ncbi:MAG: cadherin-like domain-containing protein [Nitrospirae bacterium]|nr:cadherin-like domain-containing protein [Nitrospirota bacterium]